MKVLFTVRRVYYEQIVAGTKTCEVRRQTPRWDTVAKHLARDALEGIDSQAVFICGRLPVHRRIITATHRCNTPEAALGRSPSEQGRKDVGTGPVIVFELGRETDKNQPEGRPLP